MCKGPQGKDGPPWVARGHIGGGEASRPCATAWNVLAKNRILLVQRFTSKSR